MKYVSRIRTLVLIAAFSLLFSVQAMATSHSFVYEAEREYRQNPTAENKAKLEHARTKAALYDQIPYAICLVPIIYLGARVWWSKKKP